MWAFDNVVCLEVTNVVTQNVGLLKTELCKSFTFNNKDPFTFVQILTKASKRSLKQLKTFQNHTLVKYTHSYFILAQSFCLKFIGYSALTFPWKEPLITNVNFANYETKRCYFRILIWYTYLSSSCFDNRILFTWPFVFRVVFCNFIL